MRKALTTRPSIFTDSISTICQVGSLTSWEYILSENSGGKGTMVRGMTEMTRGGRGREGGGKEGRKT